VWWRKLDEVKNEYILRNYSLFAIFLPKIIKIGGHSQTSDENNFAQFFETRCTIIFPSFFQFLSRPGKGAEYRDQPVCVCVCVCLSLWMCVCLSAGIFLEPLDRSLRNFCAHPLWPWLGPPLAALRYVMYFRFYGWRHVWP